MMTTVEHQTRITRVTAHTNLGEIFNFQECGLFSRSIYAEFVLYEFLILVSL